MFTSLRRMGLPAILAIAALAAGSGVAAAQQKVTVILDWSYPEGIHGGLMLAAEKGWYKEAGLDVDIQDGKGSNTTIQQIASGQGDIGLAQLASMAAASSNGLPVTSVMGLARNGDNGLVVPVNSGIDKVADLKGKRIAISAGGASTSFVDPFLKAGGLTRSDVTVATVDTTALLSSYSGGSVDGIISTVGYMLPTLAETRPSKAILFSDVGLHLPSYGFVVRKDAVEKNADALRKFVQINQRAWDYLFAGHEPEGADAIVAQRPQARADAKLMLAQEKAYMALFSTEATKGKPLGWQAEADWQDALTAMAAVDLVKPGLKPEDVYTNRFIAEK